MGEFANSTLIDVVAITGSAVILALNAVLLLQTFGAPIPGLSAS
jgi:manganese transport protein